MSIRHCVNHIGHEDIEDEEGNHNTISLNDIEGLKQWNEDFQVNHANINYDWKSWKKRGIDLAYLIAERLPDYSALFCLHENDKIVSQYHDSNDIYLVTIGDPIRIK